jgi:hypothetical protein
MPPPVAMSLASAEDNSEWRTSWSTSEAHFLRSDEKWSV